MSQEHSLFFQQTETGETPTYTVPTVRTRLSAPCPGKLDNIVTIISGDDARFGIMRPKNVGSCILHVACYDRNGIFIEALRLQPDEAQDRYRVPPNTHSIKIGCHRDCSGTAVLEYDTPYIS